MPKTTTNSAKTLPKAQTKEAKAAQPYSEVDVLTINEMARRLHIRTREAYNLIETPGFPLINLGGERQNRVIWGDVLQWIRQNRGGAA
ncbi:hypothetical protein H7B90_00895 [Cohnella xylanilytica]|uniref:Helix-turn-helix protein n=1 Tax=Cohnella xylanilytica TaxID=557555 RepID=A0A841TQF2_9BACL|nr:hypothetical protein [Cohnella xylanilytica]MBB6689949.1 hypothetical protein [Cohnella xylanilytica]